MPAAAVPSWLFASTTTGSPSTAYTGDAADKAGIDESRIADANRPAFASQPVRQQRWPGGRTDIDIVVTVDAGSCQVADDGVKRAGCVVRECRVTNGDV